MNFVLAIDKPPPDNAFGAARSAKFLMKNLSEGGR
jgi:hypothetical protein